MKDKLLRKYLGLEEKEILTILINKVAVFKKKRKSPPEAITLSNDDYLLFCNEIEEAPQTGRKKKGMMHDLRFQGIPVYRQEVCITTTYPCNDCSLLEQYGINLERYGDYKVGLTDQEIEQYLKERNKGKMNKTIMKKFWKVAGVNTVGVGPEGQQLMYRHDVKRFADRLFHGTPTYWD